MNPCSHRLLVLTSAVLASAIPTRPVSVRADDWPMFGRSPTHNAVSPEKGAPIEWEVADGIDRDASRPPGGNIKWSARLGSQTVGDPVVSGGIVWVGTNNYGLPDYRKEGDASVLMALRESDGKLLYRYVSPRLERRVHDWPTASLACSPFIEGDRMWFTTNRCETVCLDIGPLRREGGEPKLVWKVDMMEKLGVFPRSAVMHFSHISSVASFDRFIYAITGNGVSRDQLTVPAPGAPSLVCFEKDTGKVVWTDNSPGDEILFGQWSSPLVIDIHDRPQVIAAQGDGWVRSFDARTGKLIWEFDSNPKSAKRGLGGRGTRNNIPATPVFYENRIYIGNGDQPNHGDGPAWLYCLDPTKEGDVSLELEDGPGKGKPNPNSGVVWRYGGKKRFSRTVSNVAVHDGLAIAPDMSGLVHCLDAETGQVYWVHDVFATIIGSPLVVDGKIYVVDEDGVAWILALSKEKKILAQMDMGGAVYCSPIFAGGVLYIATRKQLFAIEAQEEAARDDEGTVGLPRGYWPQWFGPSRTNVSIETGLLKAWPREGPPLLWKSEQIGSGVASVSIAAGRVYILGYQEDGEFVVALDEDTGRSVWSSRIGPLVKEQRLMRWLSQRTPTVDGERLYAITNRGLLVCLRTEGGQVAWKRDYQADFQGKPSHWGHCDYPLVDGDKLICTPGGTTATVVALNKETGEEIWRSAVPGSDRSAHGAGVVSEAGGVRQFVTFLDKGLVSVALDDGRFLWRYDPVAGFLTDAYTPIVRDDLVFCASGYGRTMALLKVIRQGDTIQIEEQYILKRQALSPFHPSTVPVGDHVYVSRRGRNLGLMCVEMKTGNSLWEAQDPDRGPAVLTVADGHLYLRYGQGLVVLVEATPDGYREKSSFTIPDPERGRGWTFPVVSGGRLYLRNEDVLLCYNVREGQPQRVRRAPDAIFFPTPQDVVEKMLQVAGVQRKDLVYDLGCGDGRIVITAAKKHGCRAVGYEIDPDLVKVAQEQVTRKGVAEQVKIVHADIFTLDLSKADVIALYLPPAVNSRLLPQLEKLRPGTRVVSHEFEIPGVKPEKVVRMISEEDGTEHTVYLWTAPLRKSSP